jgi:hypothetical protein
MISYVKHVQEYPDMGYVLLLPVSEVMSKARAEARLLARFFDTFHLLGNARRRLAKHPMLQLWPAPKYMDIYIYMYIYMYIYGGDAPRAEAPHRGEVCRARRT